jgi:hypothetical protein
MLDFMATVYIKSAMLYYGLLIYDSVSIILIHNAARN